jgi:AcrR family transcriptional regulator
MTSTQTLDRIERACTELLRHGQPVTFTTVAERAGISRTSLYRDENLRSVIEEHRSRGRESRTLSSLASEISHLRIAVEALADRVRQHEEQLRHLRSRPSRRAN